MVLWASLQQLKVQFAASSKRISQREDRSRTTEGWMENGEFDTTTMNAGMNRLRAGVGAGDVRIQARENGVQSKRTMKDVSPV